MKPTTVLLAAAVVSFGCGVSAQTSEIHRAEAKRLPARSMLTMGGVVTTPERKPSPRFTGNALPAPPKQKAAWTAPRSSLPTNYITATELLFQQGLADPRGCEYREIEVGTGDVWRGDGGVVKTHGWVLPGRKGRPFAICWNGLVYPTVSVGTKADLQADVAAAVTNGFVSWRSALPEVVVIQPKTLQGFKGCLLLRLGRTDLAADYWLALRRHEPAFRRAMLHQVPPSNRRSATDKTQLPDTDPYLNWARDWAWSRFDRLICAHERGDENLALADARKLSAARPLIEAACARRGLKRPPSSSLMRNNEKQPYLTFLGQLPRILADLERRQKEGSPDRVEPAAFTNIVGRSKRIAAMIHDLDLVSARQYSQPGRLNPADDPVVSALIHEGDATVGPLLNCVEHDHRLTRSVGFGRDFHRDRTVISVRRAAWVALEAILHARFSTMAEMRAYWNKYKGLKLEDRWYAILRDDNARSRWQEAAANIVRPADVTRFRGGLIARSPAPTNAPVPLLGESLRAKTHPSVTELLTRRALEVPASNPDKYDLSACCRMAEYLARWDVHAALPVTKTLCNRIRTVMKYTQKPLGRYLVQLSLDRARAGGRAPFDDYAKWIVTTTPSQFSDWHLKCLEPLRQYPTNPVIQGVAEKLFGSTHSAWGSLPWKGDFSWSVVDPKLVALRAYRTLLCRELQKTNLCGTVTLQRSGYLGFTLNRLRARGNFLYTLPQDSSAATGAANEIRWCDWVAISLARSKEIPAFDPFATTTNRDRAIAEAVRHLQSKPDGKDD